jgi:hypothetical protein
VFAGHVGAALVIGRAERRVNVGTFVVAAMLLDILLWCFVLLGWESVVIPASFASTHQAEFAFPISHGLLGSLVWSALAGAAATLWYSRFGPARLRVATLVALAVFSHWLLDALVHVPELPLAGAGSPKVGLGLWQNMPLALVVEAMIVVAGLGLFVPRAPISPKKKLWFAVLVLLVLAFTVVGMTVAPAPPSATAMAVSSLATIAVVCALAAWLGRIPK